MQFLFSALLDAQSFLIQNEDVLVCSLLWVPGPCSGFSPGATYSTIFIRSSTKFDRKECMCAWHVWMNIWVRYVSHSATEPPQTAVVIVIVIVRPEHLFTWQGIYHSLQIMQRAWATTFNLLITIILILLPSSPWHDSEVTQKHGCPGHFAPMCPRSGWLEKRETPSALSRFVACHVDPYTPSVRVV